MNLGDPQWELIDPTPNVHALFVQFDGRFFWGKLGGVVVRWSKQMYSCAGICRYQGFKNGVGFCDIALSEPLLKLRPRKDLVETLLHEMIHAFLFLTAGDQNRDGHGPNFQKHMHRINKDANINITIYHTFHDEVRLYQTHWWRCSGPCQTRKPFFGTVRRTNNRAPGPNDFWWKQHQATCNGTFIKIKEPEKKTTKKDLKTARKDAKAQPKSNITNYINNTKTSNIKTINNIASTSKGVGTKINGGNTVVVTNKKPTQASNKKSIKNNSDDKNEPVKENINSNQVKPTLWTGKGNALKPTVASNKTNNVQDTVRNHWANKDLNPLTQNAKTPFNRTEFTNTSQAILSPISKSIKRNSDFSHSSQGSPPMKMNKIDNYFTNKSVSPKLNAKESDIRKIYGENFTLYEQKDDETTNKANTNKLNTIIIQENVPDVIVNCPVCFKSMKNSEINAHLDNCEPNEDKPINQPKNIIKDNNDSSPDLVTCPVCNKGVPSTDINNHVDACLNNTPENVDKFIVDTVDLTDISVEMTDCEQKEKVCPVCNKKTNLSLEEHFDDCLAFFDNDTTIPLEGTSFTENSPSKDSGAPERNSVKAEDMSSKDSGAPKRNSLKAEDNLNQETSDKERNFADKDMNNPDEVNHDPETSWSNPVECISLVDDDLDESQLFNKTGTMYPCPCCMTMVEENDMNKHLDECFGDQD